MVSQAKGMLVVPVWCDDGEIKPIINDDGRILCVLDSSKITLSVNLETSDITLPVAEQSPLSSIQAQSYGWDTSAWHKNPITWGLRQD